MMQLHTKQEGEQMRAIEIREFPTEHKVAIAPILKRYLKSNNIL